MKFFKRVVAVGHREDVHPGVLHHVADGDPIGVHSGNLDACVLYGDESSVPPGERLLVLCVALVHR
jgi:hypothetical protein